MILRTQRNFIDITQGYAGPVDGQEALERQQDVSRLLEESEAPEERVTLCKMPLTSKKSTEDPLQALQGALITLEDEETLRLALASVTRAWGSGLQIKDVGKVVDQLPPIQ